MQFDGWGEVIEGYRDITKPNEDDIDGMGDIISREVDF